MKSIRVQLLTLVLSLTIIIFVIQMLTTSYDYQRALVDEIENSLKLQAIDAAEKLDAKFLDVGRITYFTANNIAALDQYNTTDVMAVLERNLQGSELVYGSGFWLEPFEYDQDSKYYGPYLYRDGNEFKITWEYSNQEYDYFQYDWYKVGFKADKPIVWSEPFLDTVSNVPMMTAASPIDKDNRRIGVATADVGMPFLEEYMRSMKVGKAGYAFILTGQGFYLAHPDAGKNLSSKITEEGDRKLQEFGTAAMQLKEPDVMLASINGEQWMAAISPVGDTGLTIVLLLPQGEVFAVRDGVILRSIIGLLIAIGALALILSLLVSRRITQPLVQVSKYANQMAQGDYTFQVESELLNRQDEIGVMAKSFDYLNNNTKKIIEVIAASAQQLNTFSDNLAASGENIASVMEETSASTEEIAAGMEEVSSAAQEITAAGEEIGSSLFAVNNDVASMADAAREIESKAVKVQKDSQESQRLAVEVTEKIRIRLQAAMNEAQVVQQITELAQNIASIADQTNLLALNAAIEAARAGEHGKGFAVVAEEVRKLAEESAAAVDTIQQLTRQVQTAIQNLTNNAGEMLKYVNEGVMGDYQLMVNIGRQYHEDSNAVASLTATVNQSITQVSATMEEINKAIEVTASTIQQTTIGAQEIAKGSETAAFGANEINQIAQQITANVKHLNQLIQQFKI